ncbi:Uncharacterised protein [uncultured archaeon]|nr:Uncharacterised protein [uncultured archaeon]
MDVDKRLLIALIVAVSILPLWIIPIAPLADWPVYLSISREAYLINAGQVANPYYHVEFSFLGSSLVHLLLVALQSFVSLELAGKLVLSLLFVIAPLGWWAFFHFLDPAKEEWCLIGTLVNYSIYFYYGAINYLFAIPLGLAWLAMGIRAFRKGEQAHPAFFWLGILTYLAHGYVFFLAAGLLLLAYLHRRLWLNKPAELMPFLMVVLLLLGALINTIMNPIQTRDLGYYLQVNGCAADELIRSVDSQFRSSAFLATQYISRLAEHLGSINPFFFLQTVFPLPIALAGLLLLGAGWLLMQVQQARQEGRPLREIVSLNKSGVSWDRFYLAISALLLLHFLLLPSVVLVPSLYDRSAVLMFAFLLLALHAPKYKTHIFWLVAGLVLLNAGYQLILFAGHAPVQAEALQRVGAAAAQMPANSTLFVLPTNWTARYVYPLNAYYHAFVLVDNPHAYVSSMFLYQDTFILRADFPLVDDLVTWGPAPSMFQTNYPKANVSKCYAQVPGQFDYYLDEDMVLHQNPAANRTVR